jgi:hypothetical protein
MDLSFTGLESVITDYVEISRLAPLNLVIMMLELTVAKLELQD